MSIRARFDGGKFVNKVQRGSFEHRCQGASLRWQHGHDWHTKAWERVTNTPAGPVLQSHVRGVEKKHKVDTARQQTSRYNKMRSAAKHNEKKTNGTVEAQRAYGPNAAQPDIPKEQLQEISCTAVRTSGPSTSLHSKRWILRRLPGNKRMIPEGCGTR